MILVYTNDNPALVGLAKSMLEEAGFDVTLKNELSATGFPPYNLNQELWLLNEADLEPARTLLSSMNAQGADC